MPTTSACTGSPLTEGNPFANKFTFQSVFGDRAYIAVNGRILNNEELEALETRWKCVNVSVVRAQDGSLGLLLLCREVKAGGIEKREGESTSNSYGHYEFDEVDIISSGEKRYICHSYTFGMDALRKKLKDEQQTFGNIPGKRERLLAIRAMDGTRTPFAFEVLTVVEDIPKKPSEPSQG